LIKYLILIFYFSQFVIALEITPKLDFVLRYNTNDKTYTSIGQMTKGVKENNYNASGIGGDFGLSILHNDINFVIQNSSVVDLKNEA